MRKVFLDDLPRWESGVNKGKINWDESANRKERVRFIYNNIEGEFEILSCEKKHGQERKILLLKYNDEESYISCGDFLKCKIGMLLIRYQSYKTDNFEIYNILKMNEKGVVWDDIKAGEILKTNHIQYGYNEFKFIEYKKKEGKLCLKYNELEYDILTDSFRNGKIGALLNKHTKNYKINIGDTFMDEKRSLVIIDREYRGKIHGKSNVEDKWYKYKCTKCCYEGWMVENHLLKRKDGCLCCCGKTVVSGINDIATTSPWMIKLGVSKADSSKYTKNSGRIIEVKCQDCGIYKNIRISDIFTKKSIGCRTCGDSVSFPEKFTNNLLAQLNIEFETQKILSNCASKIRYDFYFEHKNKKYIIEVHGMQHYGDGFDSYGGRTLEEENANDKYKKRFAIKNGIDEYIVIDCRYSELEWIKNNILESKLREVFDLSNIDWLKCEAFAISNNIIKNVCNYWNNKKEWETTGSLAKVFNVNYNAITRFLKKGNRLGWVNYNSRDEVKRIARMNGDKSRERLSVPILAFKEGIFLGRFDSASELERRSEELFGVKLNHYLMGCVAQGKQKSHKGYTFKYVE